MKDWIRPEIKALTAYHVPDASGYIKLDAMENPYSWPQDLINKWLELLGDASLNRYPDPSAKQLKAKIQTRLDLPGDSEIILGNGSDELIQLILMAVSGKDRVVMSVEPSFVMYKMIASFLDMPYVGVPLSNKHDQFEIDLELMLDKINQHQPAVIFIAYPNNPTGNLFSEPSVDKILSSTDAIVVIDEAYFAFADKSYANKLSKYENLIVMRTVSKMGLAGLRLGYMAGSKSLLDEMDKVRLPYNINILTQLSTEFALEHKSVLDQQTEQIKQDREKLAKELKMIDGVKVYPSDANFILLRLFEHDADEVFASLKEQNILIKNLSHADASLKNCLRVTVGKAEENMLFLSVFKSTLTRL